MKLSKSNSIKKTIYLTRHGQSEYNLTEKLGGDSGLSSKGVGYSKFIYDYFKKLNMENIKVITSGMKRTNMTGSLFKNKLINKNFIEINAGIFEHYTYEQIKKENPDEYYKRKKNKFHYRYPKGESYADMENRILPSFKKLLEEEDTFLLIVHNAVLRIIFGYLYSMEEDKIPFTDIPLHTIFKIDIFDDGSSMKTVISYG